MKLVKIFIFTVIGFLPAMAHAVGEDLSESVTTDEILAPVEVETQHVQPYRPVPEPKANVDEFKKDRQMAQSGGGSVGGNSEDNQWKEATHSKGTKKAGSHKKGSGGKKQKISKHKTKPVRKIASQSQTTKQKRMNRRGGYHKRKPTAAAMELPLPPKKNLPIPGRTFAGG